MEVVDEGEAGVQARVADGGARYRIVAWSPWGGSSGGTNNQKFGISVLFVGEAGAEVLLVGAQHDSTCWNLTSGATSPSDPCFQSGGVYVLGRNESTGVGAGVYQRAGMLKAPAASVMREAWYGYSLGGAGTLVAVGAYGEAIGGVGCGSVHVYRWDGGARSEEVAGGSSELRRSVSFGWEGRLEPAAKEGGQQFGNSVAVAVRAGGGASVGVEYVAVGAPREANDSIGNASGGYAVTTGVGGGSVPSNGGVWVYGGRPLELLAHVKATVAVMNQLFGWRVSLGGGGVLAIGSQGNCTMHVADVW